MRQADYRSKQQIVNRIKSRTIQKYNITFLPREQVSDFVLSAYNALLFYAQVLNETSRLPQPDYSGEVIAKKSWNRTFTLPSGPVYLDSSGERLWDICVRGLQKSSWDFEPVMRFSTQRRRLIDHRENTIEWPEDYSWPPPSSPKTLLSNKEALVWSNQLPVTTAVVLLCVALLVLGMVVSTVWFREKHGLPRGDRWWKIHRHEIATKDGSDGLCAFIHSEAEETVESGWGQQCFYKDKLVSLRRISTTEDFPPSRSALRLLWQIQSLDCTNLTKLYGLCLGHDELFFVYENCEKGNLMKLLQTSACHNPEIKLTLTNDLIEGLYCIHNSILLRHGFLSPYVCKINKRFTLKITDYGIYDIGHTVGSQWEDKDRQREVNIDAYVAPEFKTFPYTTYNLIILAENGSAKADMYSFGGILAVLFDECQRLGVPYDLADPCWFVQRLIPACQELVPSRRPSIARIREKFQEFIGPDKHDFLDKILQRLERFVNELEQTIARKTADVCYQKNIQERLLSAMLPPFVPNCREHALGFEPVPFDDLTVLSCIFLTGVNVQKEASPSSLFDDLYDMEVMMDRVMDSHDITVIETHSSCLLVRRNTG
ncbi:hypothetical protein RvY_15398-1 [Ramazzottius varieornatus]|uniref:guanylate cyclase n=1 Tax=Ramazzottius varieornatus TaxID=947166 RepID=A0A1D1VY24_RAMVA|nr:hypothetical protein RvY_15398-1 [Ramazzottius varieornatus]